jgi:hypothetical protein
MNNFLMGTKYLLTGQSAPAIGEPQSIALSRDAGFTIYSSGQGSVKLQYKSPFFQNDWVDFYEFKTLTTGYAVPAYLTTPMNEIRAVCAGTGKYWAAVTYQN